MKYMRGVVITGQNTLAVSDRCPPAREALSHRSADPSPDLVPLHQRRPSVRHWMRLPALSPGQGGGP